MQQRSSTARDDHADNADRRPNRGVGVHGLPPTRRRGEDARGRYGVGRHDRGEQRGAEVGIKERGRVRFFFFQAEDGIRDLTVTGVQTCALPISLVASSSAFNSFLLSAMRKRWSNSSIFFLSNSISCRSVLTSVAASCPSAKVAEEIGRASCRERV